ncbi:MAG: type II secretion system protein GspF [Candidatus Dadabacteria bacterium]|nr:MAG: type II secretion system protein GspF [Candidatus Dadabacteria bacterium]
MPVYEYVAISTSGKKVKGSIDADSIRVARTKLRARGIYPTEIKEGVAASREKAKDVKQYFKSSHVSTRDLAVATRQLATLVGAGLPVVSALQALADQTDAPVLKRIITDVRENVEEGLSLAKAMAKFPRSFPRLYINMIQSGEASGTLDKVLLNLADYLEDQLELRRKIYSAMFYPALMLIICTVVIMVLLVKVVPSIVEIFERQGARLPLPTVILIGISNAIANYWMLFLLALVGAVFALRSYYKTETGRRKIDAVILQTPLLGSLYTKIATARISRTLGTLLSSGVGLLAGLDIVKNIVGNILISEALETARDGVREGRSLAGELKRSGRFPNMLFHMVAVGEKSGELESMLQKAGEAYEKEVNATLSGLTTLLEPLMIIVVGLIVLFIVISVLLPMADLIDIIGG